MGANEWVYGGLAFIFGATTGIPLVALGAGAVVAGVADSAVEGTPFNLESD